MPGIVSSSPVATRDRLAAYQERAAERDGDVHCVAQLVGSDVRLRALELIELLVGGHPTDLSAF